MIRSLVLRRLDRVEQELGESVEYIRHIARVSLRAFFKFVQLLPASRCRRLLPLDAYHVARIAAARDEDCGTCVQIEVNLALKAGVERELLRSVLDRAPERLPSELADVSRFTEAVVTAAYTEGELREKLRQRYGEEALVELALAIATCRVFPIIKRALGYARSCAAVPIRLADRAQPGHAGLGHGKAPGPSQRRRNLEMR